VAIAAAASPYGLALRDDSHAETTTSSGCAFTRYRPLTDNPVLRRLLESGQYTSIDYTQTLADHGVLASVGSVGDAFDNALAESFVDSFKTELIADRVWKTRSQLELAVVEYLGWFNHTRLHENLGDLPPAEFEAQALRAQAAPQAGERHTINGRPLRWPVASEILIS
jgi:putative transposase